MGAVIRFTVISYNAQRKRGKTLVREKSAAARFHRSVTQIWLRLTGLQPSFEELTKKFLSCDKSLFRISNTDF